MQDIILVSRKLWLDSTAGNRTAHQYSLDCTELDLESNWSVVTTLMEQRLRKPLQCHSRQQQLP